MITQDRLRKLLSYNTETGNFTWLVTRRPQTPAGSRANFRNADGYVFIRIDRVGYMAHKLAWLYMFGELPAAQIDHINGMRDDNRIANLRLATPSENGRNRGATASNTSGVKGVTWHKRDQRWQAQIGHNGYHVHLGYFTDLAAATAAYEAAASRLHGEFARIK